MIFLSGHELLRSMSNNFFAGTFFLGLMILLAGCMQPAISSSVGMAAGPSESSTIPEPESVFGPPPPLGPATVGTGVGNAGPLSDMVSAMACLVRGQPVYGLVQQNGAVRTRPDENACQTGRSSSGSLVRIESVYEQGVAEPLVTLDRRQEQPSMVADSMGYPIGYDEDVLPIFEQNCASCHGGVIQSRDLQVTEYDTLMAGGDGGEVVVPGAPEASELWSQIASGAMPLVGELAPEQKRVIYDWIDAGAPETRPTLPSVADLWVEINSSDVEVSDNNCEVEDVEQRSFLNAQLVRLASCAVRPTAERIAELQPRTDQPVAQGVNDESTAPPERANTSTDAGQAEAAAADQVDQSESRQENSETGTQSVPAVSYTAGQSRIQAAPLGLAAPSDSDPWLAPRGGYCIEQHLQRLQDNQAITGLTFAPDGRLFMAFDALSTGEPDPNVFFDAFHPSRSVAIYDSINRGGYYTVLSESSRVTDMVWHNGALYLNRAGEVGRIPDGGGYETLASGFAVNGRLFHANNGIAIANGWLYVSAGGVRDGYSDGIINPGATDRPAETVAVNVAGNGNPYAARIVRARLDRLLAERSISVFQTAARGVRNPYGLTSDPFGRLWFTDNGATNVGPQYLAGDEVNLLDPASLSPEAVAGNEDATPFYGFPITLSGNDKEWYTDPVLPLENTTAPTGITWAQGTIYFAQYGRQPGLYRLASAGDQLVAERILLGWPIQAVTTAPDGAIWIGTGDGGLYRLAPGC